MLLTMVVVYSGYRYSSQTISFLNTVINHHGPILREIDEVQHLLQQTDEVFHLRALQSEILPDDISTLYARLEQNTESLIQNEESVLKQQLANIGQTIDQIIYAQTRQAALEYLHKLELQLDSFRQTLYQIYTNLTPADLTSGIANTINTIGDIATEIDIQIIQYINQDIIQQAQVIQPLSEAEKILENVQPSQNGNLNLSAYAANKLNTLSNSIKRLRSSILFYDEELNRLDPSEAHVERAKIQVNEMRQLVLDQIETLNNSLQIEIQQSQANLSSSSRQTLQLFLILSIASILITILIGVTISILISNSAQALERGAKEFAEGNLQYRVPNLRIREFSTFAGLFNRMASSIESKQEDILDNLAKLNKINAELDQRVIVRTADMETALNKAEQANRAKSLFLSNMTHELRTPMHAILGFSELGLSKAKSSKNDSFLRYFQRISESGSRLLILINDLLDLSKLESGKMEYDFSVQSLEPVFKEVEDELENLFQQKNIELVYLTEIDFEFSFDSAKIHRVLINLLSNSIKFSPENSQINITCNWSRLPSGSRYDDKKTIPAIEITIGDQGIGVPEDQVDNIFDPFTQSTLTQSAAGGTGLGLSICRQIIHDHYGTISARNRAETGTDFILKLPLSRVATVTPIRQVTRS